LGGFVDELASECQHRLLHRLRHFDVRPQAANDRVARPDRLGQRRPQWHGELVQPGLLVRAEEEVDPRDEAAAFLDVAVERDVLDDRVGRR
jgi:hypothetical protein